MIRLKARSLAPFVGLLLALPLPASASHTTPCFWQPGAALGGSPDLVLQGPGSTLFSFGPGGRVSQPFPAPLNMAACSLSTQRTPSYAGGYTLDIVQWDPLALAPDPTTVALRSLALLSRVVAVLTRTVTVLAVAAVLALASVLTRRAVRLRGRSRVGRSCLGGAGRSRRLGGLGGTRGARGPPTGTRGGIAGR